MIFLGYTTFNGQNNANIHPSNFPNELATQDSIIIENVIVDEFYLTDNPSYTDGELIPPVSDWDFDTKINAKFEGNLLGGNVDFTAEEIISIRVKRADVNSYNWITLFDIPIETNDDLNFVRKDSIARGNQEYKYALVPVWNDNIEGNYNINTVVSDFDGLWIVEKDMSINAMLDLQMNTTRNIITSTVTPIGRKYPYVNQYGETNYTSGSFDAIFIKFDYNGCELDLDGAVKYRELVEEFLTNGQPKIIKHYDGRIWLAAITDNIPKSENEDYRLPVQTVNFVEIGKHDSASDLYDANIIDLNYESEEGSDGILSYTI